MSKNITYANAKVFCVARNKTCQKDRDICIFYNNGCTKDKHCKKFNEMYNTELKKYNLKIK